MARPVRSPQRWLTLATVALIAPSHAAYTDSAYEGLLHLDTVDFKHGPTGPETPAERGARRTREQVQKREHIARRRLAYYEHYYNLSTGQLHQRALTARDLLRIDYIEPHVRTLERMLRNRRRLVLEDRDFGFPLVDMDTKVCTATGASGLVPCSDTDETGHAFSGASTACQVARAEKIQIDLSALQIGHNNIGSIGGRDAGDDDSDACALCGGIYMNEGPCEHGDNIAHGRSAWRKLPCNGLDIDGTTVLGTDLTGHPWYKYWSYSNINDASTLYEWKRDGDVITGDPDGAFCAFPEGTVGGNAPPLIRGRLACG